MQISSNSLYNIGSNYSIKLNEKEALVFEEDKVTKKTLHSSPKKEEKKSANELSSVEQRVVKELQARDSEVKAHEAAHQASGGGMTGAASYTYQQGPDGKMYAIGGEVSISMPSGGSPQENLRNARQLAAAALAAGSPSPQDHAVASSARMMEMKALQQLQKQAQQEISGKESYKNEASKNSNIELSKNKGIDIPA